MKNCKALVVVAAVILSASCASKNTVQEGFASKTEKIELQSRNVAMHVVETDNVQNMGKGIKLVLQKDLNIKPNMENYVFEKLVGDDWRINSLSVAKSENFDRVLKAGEVFEIDSIERSVDFTKEYSPTTTPNDAYYRYSYTFTFKNSKKLTKLTISTHDWVYVTKYNYLTKCQLTVGEFREMLKDYFKVSQPAPVLM